MPPSIRSDAFWGKGFIEWGNVTREVCSRPALRAVAERFAPLDTFRDMEAFAAFDAGEPAPDYTMFPGVCPG